MEKVTWIKRLIMAIKDKVLIDYKLINLEVDTLDELKVLESDLFFKFESKTKPSIYRKTIVVKVKNTGEVYKYKVEKQDKKYYIVTM